MASVKHGHYRGGKPTPEWQAWQNMKDRCLNKRGRQWADYGGRGITVDIAWLEFANFLRDMGLRPSPLHSLDRIDNNLGYNTLNCRWATEAEQQNNKRKRRYFRKP